MGRRRHGVIPEKVQIQWLGTGKLQDRRFRRFGYQSCQVGNMVLKVGDHVYVNNTSDPDDPEGAYIARIESLFDNGFSDDNFRAKVQWYWRQNELKNFKLNIQHPKEVLISQANIADDIDLTTVLGLCDVIQCPIHVVPDILMKSKADSSRTCYFTRFAFDGHIVSPLENGSETAPSKKSRSKKLESSQKKAASQCPLDREDSESDDELPQLIKKSKDGYLPNTKESSQCALDRDESESEDELTPVKKVSTSIKPKPKACSTSKRTVPDNIDPMKLVVKRLGTTYSGTKLYKVSPQKPPPTNESPGARKKLELTSPTRHRYRTEDVVNMVMEDIDMEIDGRPEESMSHTSETSLVSNKENQRAKALRSEPNRPGSAKKRKKEDSDDEEREEGPVKKSRRDAKTPNKTETAKTPRKSVSSKTPSKKESSKTPSKKESSKTPSKENATKTPKSSRKVKAVKTPKSSVTSQRESSRVTPSRSTANDKQTPKSSRPSRGQTPTTSDRQSSARRKLNTDPGTPTNRRVSSLRTQVFTSDGAGNISSSQLEFEKSSRGRTRRSILYNEDRSDDEDADFVPGAESSDEDFQELPDDLPKKRGRTPRSKTGTPQTPTRQPRRGRIMTPRGLRTPGRKETPSIPSRGKDASKPGTVLEQARARLHVSVLPETLPCREDEFADIYHFVRSKIEDGTGGCMYIAGVPGTGKTATVHQVMRSLKEEYADGDLPPFRYIEINGMKLTDPHQANVQILLQLNDQRATADHAASLLDKQFSRPDPRREPIVLLVDELDLLWTRKQTVMYNIFDWPTRPHARLIVLAIANTMDLPERIMMNRVASRLGLTRMTFQPYTHKQLIDIVSSRMKGVKAFEPEAVQLAARKVAALSGDARRALDICRRATEIAESEESGKGGLVGMPHVDAALQEMYSAPKIVAIRTSSFQEQMFLKSVISEFQRTGVEEAVFSKVYRQHVSLCRIEGVLPPSATELACLSARLGSFRLLLLDSGRNDLNQRIRLNVSQDDVLYALRDLKKENLYS